MGHGAKKRAGFVREEAPVPSFVSPAIQGGLFLGPHAWVGKWGGKPVPRETLASLQGGDGKAVELWERERNE